MTLTRRSFLQLAGVTLAAAHIPAPLWQAAGQATPRGRVLKPVELSDPSGRFYSRLWPDSVVRIVDSAGGRFRLPEGWVPQSAVQPMMPVDDDAIVWSAIPCVAEVVGPVAPVRAACSPDATILTRIGHGGVLHVVDALHAADGQPEWLGVGTSPQTLLGWTPARHWRPTSPARPSGDNRWLRIDVKRQRLSAFEGETEVASAPVSTDSNTPAEAGAHIGGRLPALVWDDESNVIQGVPWALELPDVGVLAGAYWHNEFGRPARGPAIQVAPAVARWLYEWLPDGAIVTFG